MKKNIKYLSLLFADSAIFTASAILALFLRAGSERIWILLWDLTPYFITSFISSLVIFPLVGVHKQFFRFFSLHEFRNITLAVGLALLTTVMFSFGLFRLEQVPRSLPFIQGLVALAGISGLRLFGRWLGRKREQQQQERDKEQRHGVLIIGFTPVADIYLRSVELFGKNRLAVVGILDERPQYRGQRMRHCEVLGAPEELPQILKQLQIHGVTVRKLVMAESYDLLSEFSHQVIARVKTENRIFVEDFYRSLDAFMRYDPLELQQSSSSEKDVIPVPAGLRQAIETRLSTYGRLKRGADVVVAALMGLFFLPMLMLVTPLILLSMGAPVFFWQERPGQNGRVIRIYKLRTLKQGVGPGGQLLTDEERQTSLGKWLRRWRIDELPQLYNVLKGDLSFIGPRPILPIPKFTPEDMPTWIHLRQLGRPGLTGWAQVHGGQALEKHLKVILDVWYLANMSPVLDIKILALTAIRLLKGADVEVDAEPIRRVCEDLSIPWDTCCTFGLTERSGAERTAGESSAKTDSPAADRKSSGSIINNRDTP